MSILTYQSTQFSKIFKTDNPRLLYVFTCQCESTTYKTKNGQKNGAKICTEHGTPCVMCKKLCPDCGEWFYCSKKAQKKTRCTECNKVVRKVAARERSFPLQQKMFNCAEEDFYATLEDVSKFFSISKERTRQIQNTAARKFKKNFEKMFGNPEVVEKPEVFSYYEKPAILNSKVNRNL